MPKVTVFDMSGKNVGEMELNEDIFGIEPNQAVLHAAVVQYLANQRQGTQSTKTRTEVRGGGRKPWRQKGTGRARHGSIRSPIWVGGGVALGPKPRSYRTTMNKKTKRLALKSALSAKVQADEFIIVDKLTMDEYKTKAVVSMLEALGANRKALLVTAGNNDQKLAVSARNIPGVASAPVNSLNVYDLLNYDKIIIAQEAVEKLEEVYA